MFEVTDKNLVKMYHKLKLFVQASRSFAKSKPATRNLYTDPIYPYPFNYMNTKKHPSMHCYRENWIESPWEEREYFWKTTMFRMFWTYWWFMLFTYPDYVTGHDTIPDPSEWSDEELGIPPDDVGPYRDWLETKLQESQ